MYKMGSRGLQLKMVWEEMPTTSRTCWMSLLSLYFLRSLLANLERVLPQLGIDTDLAAWGNILDPRF